MNSNCGRMLPGKTWNGTVIPSAESAAVIYPGGYPGLRSRAETISAALGKALGDNPPVLTDDEIMPSRDSKLPVKYRGKHLFVLGNINTNRVLLTPYARYYCAADALYPGTGGWVVRTMMNPLGSGFDMILAGGSDTAGITAAAERLTELIREYGTELPFILEIEHEKTLKDRLMNWAEAPLDAPYPRDIDSLLIYSGNYAVNFAWTGDRRFGEYGAECLRRVNRRMEHSYGDRHYRMERVIRGLPWLVSGGFLTPEEIHRTQELLLGMQTGSEDAWWRKTTGEPPLGHRHHAKGTFEFLLISHYLLEQSNPDDHVRVLCERWIRECRVFLDALAAAGHDDQDDETTLNTIGTIFWYALGEERYGFFQTGEALRTARRAIALHDNMNTAAGPGGYAESLLGAFYMQQEALIPAAASAFWYGDSELKWLLKNFPNLDPPARGGFWAFSPIFMHKFDTGPELPDKKPEEMSGIHLFEPAPYQRTLCRNPPEHIEPLGHFTDAPETWLFAAGIGPLQENGKKYFDKVVYRRGFDYTDPYLLLQGYQGGFRWQGHMQGANCITRFSQEGHILLMQNTRQHSPYYKNGVLVSDGINADDAPPFADCRSVSETAGAAFSSTDLSPYNNTCWNRKIFIINHGRSLFITEDTITALRPGDYGCVCTWRTPIFGKIDGPSWFTEQGNCRFTVTWDGDPWILNEEEPGLGAASPYVLHQFIQKTLKQNESAGFTNLFYTRERENQNGFTIKKSENGVFISSSDGFRGYCGSNPEADIAGISAAAEGLYLDETTLSLFGCSAFNWEGIIIDSPEKITLYIDTRGGFLEMKPEQGSTGKTEVKYNTESGAEIAALSQTPIRKELSEDRCRRMADSFQSFLCGNSSAEAVLRENQPKEETLPEKGDVYPLVDIPELIKELTVHSSPPPADALPEQLIDRVPNELRETWRQWPEDAREYSIRLSLLESREVSSVRLLGDSRNSPLLRTFHPLPESIMLEGKNPGSPNTVTKSGPKMIDDTPSMRYRGFTDYLETRSFSLNETIKEITIKVPNPGYPLVLQEIELYGKKTMPAPVRFMIPVQFDESGPEYLVIADDSPRLSVINSSGAVESFIDLPKTVYTLECIDLEGAGTKSICLGMMDGGFMVLTPSCEILYKSNLAEDFDSLGETIIGWMHTPFSLAVWQRDSEGRAALAAGGYGAFLFLGPDFKPLGHSFVDGSWVTDIITGPDGSGAELDIWTRNGWNHGISRYRGKPGFESSGSEYVLGGAAQPLFRDIRKVIPFVNGRSRLFQWAETDKGPCLVAAAENGIGVLSMDTDDFLWKHEGGIQITAARIWSDPRGDQTVTVGDSTGYISDYLIPTGKPGNRRLLDAPVEAVFPIGGRRIIITRRSVFVTDDSYTTNRKITGDIITGVSFERSAAVLTGDGGIHLVKV
ncbi:MAG: hypothetical protein ACLFST_03680 [Spirochaetia bacterium]